MDNEQPKIYKNNRWANCSGCDNEFLLDRISELEKRVEHLRVSRRVLMDLLEKVEREKMLLDQKLKRRTLKIKRSIPEYLHVIEGTKDSINYEELND